MQKKLEEIRKVKFTKINKKVGDKIKSFYLKFNKTFFENIVIH